MAGQGDHQVRLYSYRPLTVAIPQMHCSLRS